MINKKPKIHTSIYALMEVTEKIVSRMAREYKYTIGSKLRELTLGLLLYSDLAYNNPPNKDQYLGSFMNTICMIDSVLDYLNYLGLMSTSESLQVVDRLHNVSTQASNWKNYKKK